MKKTIQSNRGAVRFSLKHSKNYLIQNRNVISPIFLWFSYKGIRVKKSTGFSVQLEDWDFKRQRVRTNKITLINARTVNNYLNSLELNLLQSYTELVNVEVEVNRTSIKGLIKRVTNTGDNVIEHEVDLDFLSFATEFLNQKKPLIAPLTHTLYKHTITKLKKFSKKSKQEVKFDSFTRVFLNDFKRFLEVTEKLSLNTISKHFKNLKMFVIEAQSQGLVVNPQLKLFSVKSEETSAIYLNNEEIKKFHDYDLSKSKGIELSRDIFLMGCYTGQRISDYNGLSIDDMIEIEGIKYFKISQNKTKQVVYCPITVEMREIMSRYGDCPPPKQHECTINANIKIIGKLLEIDQRTKCQITKAGKREVTYVPKYKLIHSHTARRSFCTNKYKQGMRITDIMHFSGHKTEQEFQKYIRIQGEERTNYIVGQGYFNIK